MTGLEPAAAQSEQVSGSGIRGGHPHAVTEHGLTAADVLGRLPDLALPALQHPLNAVGGERPFA